MKQQQVALFDLDGVVLDTEGQYSSFWAEQGNIYFPTDPDFAEKIKGSALVSIFNNYFTDPAQQMAVKRALDEFEITMSYDFFPEVVPFLNQLRQRGIPTAVVTSSNHSKMQGVYAKRPELKSLFDRIFTAEDSSVGKPAPDCYLNAAKQMGADIASCVIFEDSVNGLKSAKASGAKVVALTTTNEEATVAPYADYIYPNFELLNNSIDELFNQ